MQNPWLALNPIGPPYVLEMHEDYVRLHNERCSPEYQLMVHAIHEPGRKVRLADNTGINSLIMQIQWCQGTTSNEPRRKRPESRNQRIGIPAGYWNEPNIVKS